MIVEWFLTLVAGVVDWFGSLLPDWNLPSELTDPNGMLAGIFSLGAGLGPFVDWAFVGLVGAIPLIVWVIGVLWRFARMIASHIPFFGGNG